MTTPYDMVMEIKRQVEQSLPPNLVNLMQEQGISLTLGSIRADQPTITVADNLVDDLAERELLDEMVSYRKDVTGVANVLFISPKGFTRHAARLKVAINPPDSIDPRTQTASIAIHDGSVVAGDPIPPNVLNQVRRFIDANRDTLLDYWEYRIDTSQLGQRLKPI